MKNLIKIFSAFMSGEDFAADAEPSSGVQNKNNEQVLSELEKMKMIERKPILDQLLQQGKEINHVPSYMNF